MGGGLLGRSGGGGAGAAWANLNSLQFGGTDEYLDGGNVHQYNAGQPFTYNIAFRVPNGGFYSLMGTHQGGVGGDAGIEVAVNGNVFVQIRDNSGNRIGWITSSSGFGDDAFHFLTMSSDGSQTDSGIMLAIDGVAPAKSSLGSSLFTTITHGRFNVGRRGAAGGGYMIGYLDEGTVFTSALTLADHIELRGVGGALIDPTTHSKAATLASYWMMGDPPDGIGQIDDRVGTSHLTPVNMEGGDIVPVVPP